LRITPKIGKCIDCPDSADDKPLTAGRCQTHYWAYRKKVNDEKNSTRDSPEQKVYKIKQASDKLKTKRVEYEKLKAEYLKDKHCEYPNCYSLEVTLHHAKGRIGDNLTDVRFFKALCPYHHNYCEEHPLEAKKLGLSFDRLAK
jgi:DNA-directed RNA polymerase subunit M/transcription elongation factor TFIIS